MFPLNLRFVDPSQIQPPVEDRVPTRIRVSMNLLELFQGITDPAPVVGSGFDGTSTVEPQDGRKLDEAEQATYRQALHTMLQYSAGEIECQEPDEDDEDSAWLPEPDQGGLWVGLDVREPRTACLAIMRENSHGGLYMAGRLTEHNETFRPSVWYGPIPLFPGLVVEVGG